MEQRRLRLGDILDDYCPRERRLTNHAVVAMIAEDVKQTRCTTCDAEHAYKGGKVPRRKKKETTSALYKEVLAGHLAPDAAPLVSELEPEALDVSDSVTEAPSAPVVEASPEIAAAAPPQEEAQSPSANQPAEESPSEERQVEEGPVHRPLIRAQLPRIEGQKEERRLPEFTIRQRGNGHFRGGTKAHRPGGPGGNSGNRTHGGQRFAAPRSAGPGGRSQSGGRGAGGGFRSGGGRKRSR
jgi:translation initiation factor IF-2